MSGDGFGKVPKHKKAHGAKKPYERSTSFLGKIKDSMKDLLMPSWLIGSTENGSDSESNTVSSLETTSTLRNINGPGFNSDSLSQSSNQSLFRTNSLPQFGMSQRSSLSSSASTAHGPNTLVGEPYLNDFGPAPNVNVATLEQQNVSWHAKKESPLSKLTSVFQQEPKRRKTEDPARLRMSDSYINEAAESSCVVPGPTSQLMMSTSVPRNSLSSLQDTNVSQLWSAEDTKLRKAIPRPVKDRPAFNSSLFSSSSKVVPDSFGNSSFYSGKTCYGGSASKKNKAQKTALPYKSSLPLRKQVTVSKLNTSLNATTSTTAQRILETLDKMSTPLGDAKRIPQDESVNDSIISFTPSSYRRASSFSSLRSATRPLQLPDRGGPPTVQHQTLSQAVLARNRNKVTGLDRRRQSSNTSELLVSQDISDGPKMDTPSVTVAPPSTQSLPSGTGGKLKSKKFSQHISSRKDDDEEVVVEPNLSTNFTLPIQSINPISLPSTSSTLKSKISTYSCVSKDNSSSKSMQFTFSTPIEERRPSVTNQSLNNLDQGFKFSTPIKASQTKSNAVGAEGGSKQSPEPAVGASSVVTTPMSFSNSTPVWGSTAPKPKAKAASPDIGGTSSSFSPSYGNYNDSSAAPGISLTPASSLKSGSVMDILGGKSASPPSATNNDDLMAKFKKPAGTWECDACMLSNKPEATKCIACETLKPGSKSSVPVQDDLMAKFKKPTGTWECDACMLSNKPEATNCVACETLKPGAKSSAIQDDLMSKFKKPSGSWECDACMLSNKPDAIKCIACETPKPGAAAGSGSSLSSNAPLSEMFKKPSGNWECDTCMVQNSPSASRCVACDSPKPGQESAQTASKESSSAAAVKIAPGGGFVFNAPSTNTTSTGSGGFKFGSSSVSTGTSSSNGPAPTGFVFGKTPEAKNSTAATTAAPLTGGFKFGAPVPSKTVTSTASSTGGASGFSLSSSSTFSPTSSNAATASTQPFSFGAVAVTKPSNDSTSVSSVVEVPFVDKLNSNTNGSNDNFGVDNNNKPSQPQTKGFAFGSTMPTLSSAPSLTSSFLTSSVQSSNASSSLQPQLNFNFGPPSSISSNSGTVPSANNQIDKVSVPGLFQFGSTPSLPSANNAGLGTGPSLATSKPLINGTATLGEMSNGTKPEGFGNTVSAPAFGAFGASSFSANPSVNAPVPNNTTKRSIAFGESEPTSAKRAFAFGASDNQTGAAVNGGFHFGGSTPAFGSVSAPSGPSPAGGFVFGGSSNSKPLAVSQPSVPTPGGFNFGAANAVASPSGGFNFGQSSTVAKPDQAAPMKPGLASNFNFGGQQASAPFQFGAKPAVAPAPTPFAAPNVIAPSIGTAPMGMSAPGTFNMGSSSDTGKARTVRKAIRRIRK